MNTQDAMEEVSVEELIGKYNLIVPEIQREYVWGNNDFQILDTFIEDIKDGYSEYEIANNKPNSESRWGLLFF